MHASSKVGVDMDLGSRHLVLHMRRHHVWWPHRSHGPKTPSHPHSPTGHPQAATHVSSPSMYASPRTNICIGLYSLHFVCLRKSGHNKLLKIWYDYLYQFKKLKIVFLLLCVIGFFCNCQLTPNFSFMF